MLTRILAYLGAAIVGSSSGAVWPVLLGVGGAIVAAIVAWNAVLGGPSAVEVAATKRAEAAEKSAATSEANAKALAQALARAKVAEEAAGKARTATLTAEAEKREAWEKLRRVSAPRLCLGADTVRKINTARGLHRAENKR